MSAVGIGIVALALFAVKIARLARTGTINRGDCMGLSRYCKKWWLQGYTFEPSPFPPPWDFPVRVYGDSREVQGMSRQDQSTETLIAASQGIQTMGRFACHPSENLKHGDVLRSEEMGVFIRLEGDALQAPEFATTQVKTFAAVVTSRTIEEHAENEAMRRAMV